MVTRTPATCSTHLSRIATAARHGQATPPSKRPTLPGFKRLALARPSYQHHSHRLLSTSSTTANPSSSSTAPSTTYHYHDRSPSTIARLNPSSITLTRPPTIPSPELASPAQVALLHTVFARPSTAALSALSARLQFSLDPTNVAPVTPASASSLVGRPSTSVSSEEEGIVRLSREILEQCLVSSTFWTGVRSAEGTLEKAGLKEVRAEYTHYCDNERLHNGGLAVIGGQILGMLGAEELARKYPHLPQKILSITLTQYAGSATCAQIARGWGVSPALSSEPMAQGLTVVQAARKAQHGNHLGLLRWYRGDLKANATAERQARKFEVAMAHVSKAVVGAIFQKFGLAAARQFAHAHWFSRQADLAEHIKYNNPSLALQETLHKYGREPPEARLLMETGRTTSSPLFVVGVFTSSIKLGAGIGSSLKMAKYRAHEDAMRRIYLAAPAGGADLSNLPSDTAIYGDEGVGEYQSPELGDTETKYESGRVGDGPRVYKGERNGLQGLAEEALGI